MGNIQEIDAGLTNRDAFEIEVRFAITANDFELGTRAAFNAETLHLTKPESNSIKFMTSK